MNHKRLEWDFGYHVPNLERGADHGGMREQALRLATYINGVVPDGREKSLAITKLEEVMFWANAAIARQDRPGEAK